MITDCVSDITDPRKSTNKFYSLESLMLIIFSSVISGYDTVEEMVEFTTLKLDWLNKWVELTRAPSAETLRFIICAINPNHLTQCFKRFVELNGLSTEGDCISIDGKTMRGTGTADNDAIHVISAWSNKHGLTLAALESKGKKNEIHTIPDVMDMVSANNAIFSTDAMGCQTKIAAKAIDTGNDYMLQIKDNQANLLKEIQAFQHKIEREGYTKDECDSFEEIDKGHGRIEVRKYTQFQLTDWIDGVENWKNLTTAVKVERTRIISDKEATETSWYISSLSVDPKLAAKSIRCHWEVENPLHWRLDVVFREDEYSLYSANGAINMAIIKRFCMNLIKTQAPPTKRARTFKSKVMCCAIDDAYREKALFG